MTNKIEGYVDATVIAEKPIYDGNRISLRTALRRWKLKYFCLIWNSSLTRSLDITATVVDFSVARYH